MAMKKIPAKPASTQVKKQGIKTTSIAKTVNTTCTAMHRVDVRDADERAQPSSWDMPLPEDFYCGEIAKFQYESWQKSPALKRRFAHIIKQGEDVDMVPPKKPKSRVDLLRYANCTLVYTADNKDMRFQVEVEDEVHLNFKMRMSKGASFGDIFARISLHFECDSICLKVMERPPAFCTQINDRRSVMMMLQ